MFYVKQPDGEEITEWVLACQANERKQEIGIINDEGLRVEPVPEVKVKTFKFEPSGLINPNEWRNKR